MKKLLKLFLFSLFILIGNSAFSDTFTDAIQDLAFITACIGTYSMTEAGGGWYEDPHDYYTPQIAAERLAKESGDKTKTDTFYGVCFNYAEAGYSYIQRYLNYYNECNMNGSQFWIAKVDEKPNPIELVSITDRAHCSYIQNGEYIKTYETSLRYIESHKHATHHAWLWIQRADGVWFWVDPTWTDNTGYVVYGYVDEKNRKEIQCKPDERFCQNYPDFLYNLETPPAMGPRIPPSKATNRQELLGEVLTDATAAYLNHIIQSEDSKISMLFTLINPVTPKDNFFNSEGYQIGWIFSNDLFAFELSLGYLRDHENDNSMDAVGIEFGYGLTFGLEHFTWFIEPMFGPKFNFNREIDSEVTAISFIDEINNMFLFRLSTNFMFDIAKFYASLKLSYDNFYGFSYGIGLGFKM